MHTLISTYLIFFKIGAVSFGGGYAMLPFIEEEIIKRAHYLTYNEFLDILAISQITPGPIAINAATFIGLKHIGILGAALATLGIVSGPFIFMNLASLFLNKYKNSKFLENILHHIRPVTVALIFSAFLSTFQQSILDIKSLIIFIISFIVLCSKKFHPILVIFMFGFLGIILTYLKIL